MAFLSRLKIPNPFASLHNENNHANARQAYRTVLRLRFASGIGNNTELKKALEDVQRFGGVDDNDIAILQREMSIPIAFR